MTDAPTTRETADHAERSPSIAEVVEGEARPHVSADHAELARLAEAATQGPWDRMVGRGLVRAIRDDLAVPLFEPLEPYSDPLLDAPTCRVGGKVVFRANSQAARESAAIRQAVHNAAFIVAANPTTVLALLSEIAALRGDLTETRVAADLLVSSVRADLRQAERQRDKLRKALEEIADEAPYRSGYCQSDVEYGPALSADEMQAVARQALANQGAE